MNKNKDYLKSDEGFSLAEMLVVICIMMILVGLSALSIGMVNNANVSKAANTFNSAINSSKVKCMSKGTVSGQLILSKQGGGLYYQMGADDDYHKICTQTIAFKVVYSNGTIADSTSIADATTITSISFNSAGMVTTNPQNISKIIFTHGNRSVETVLYNETGKHEVNLL